MQNQRELVEWHQGHDADDIFVRQPLLFASAKLDGNNGGPNEIHVYISGLEQGRLTIAPSGRMGVLFEVVPEGQFPDRFRTQLIQVGEGYVGFRIKRLDNSGGWSQRLTIKVVGEVR